ncbi:SOS response-associated peptidase [Candidatus Laterigemmans baculatus]|uniref:SOS response-associated peptidase n=1 Tax=Candidatus Laterigemmans baculatus TaxID=2770505 RepID=UPI0013DB0277|nr:SOS response-associated peptidase [Candidatus Laterigemmans baculatus]
MCGRFNLRTSVAEIAQRFLPGIDRTSLPPWQPRYNIAPTQSILCVLQPEVGQPRQLSLFRWGLVPSWADDVKIGNRMINARSETAAEKPSFRAAWKSRRCLIPADGYYEWQKTAEGKQPYEINASDGSLLALAGLWERNDKADAGGQPLYSCTILTTAANRFAAQIHDRMPVILRDDFIDRWLDPSFRDPELLHQATAAVDEGMLQMHPVSKRLNAVTNEGADLLNSN